MIDLSKEGECMVKLSGPNASVEKARRAVVELLHLDAESVRVVEVPTDIVDIVLGKGGEKLRHLESEHSGRFPPQPSHALDELTQKYSPLL